jgi:hypothetical protein
MTIIGTIGAVQYKGASDVVGWLIFGLLVFPAAYVIHKTIHWVVFGTVK